MEGAAVTARGAGMSEKRDTVVMPRTWWLRLCALMCVADVVVVVESLSRERDRARGVRCVIRRC